MKLFFLTLQDEIITRVWLLMALIPLSACSTFRPALVTPTPSPTHFRSQAYYLEVDLPAGWAASEDGGLLARPYVGLVAFNSWGQENFWARMVEAKKESGVSYTYSPETVLRQIPEGGAYIVLIDFAGGPEIQVGEYGPEHSAQDLKNIWEETNCREEGPVMVNFFKWGRLLRLEVYCSQGVSDETVGEVNRLLGSWRFDRVPVGDMGWATVAAREMLPQEVNPHLFPIVTGGPTERLSQQRDIVWKTRADTQLGNVVAVTFSVRWDAPQTGRMADDCPPESCHWWRYEARPDGDVILVEEGGAALPSE